MENQRMPVLGQGFMWFIPLLLIIWLRTITLLVLLTKKQMRSQRLVSQDMNPDLTDSQCRLLTTRLPTSLKDCYPRTQLRTYQVSIVLVIVPWTWQTWSQPTILNQVWQLTPENGFPFITLNNVNLSSLHSYSKPLPIATKTFYH